MNRKKREEGGRWREREREEYRERGEERDRERKHVPVCVRAKSGRTNDKPGQL